VNFLSWMMGTFYYYDGEAIRSDKFKKRLLPGQRIYYDQSTGNLIFQDYGEKDGERVHFIIDLERQAELKARYEAAEQNVTLIHSIPETSSGAWAAQYLPLYMKEGGPPEEWFTRNPGLFYIGLYTRAIPRQEITHLNSGDLKRSSYYGFEDTGKTIYFAVNPKPEAVWISDENIDSISAQWTLWSNNLENMEKPNRFSGGLQHQLEKHSYPTHSAFYDDFHIIGVNDHSERVVINSRLFGPSVLFVPGTLSPLHEDISIINSGTLDPESQGLRISIDNLLACIRKVFK